MKFKRSVAAIYGTLLVAGLTLLITPDIRTKIQESSKVTPTVAPTVSPAVEAPTPTTVVSPTVTPLPTPTADLDLIYQNSIYSIPETSLVNLVTDYIHAYYANDLDAVSEMVTDATMVNRSHMENDSDNVQEIQNLKLYCKPGINELYEIVYACYDIKYNGSSVAIPMFSEYLISKKEDGTFLILNEALAEDTENAVIAARQTEAVLQKSVYSLIQRYHIAAMNGDEDLLKQCVKNSSFLDMDYFESRYYYTENFKDYSLLMLPGINEFAYVAFVTYSEKLVLIDTPAPCMESYFIYLDKYNGNPYIYLGVTSLETDAYYTALEQRDDVQALAEKTNKAMEEAVLKDDDLMNFYQNMSDGITH